MFPGLAAANVDRIDDLPDALAAALVTDGPSVISIECSADEIPPFANFLTKSSHQQSIQKEIHSNVGASA